MTGTRDRRSAAATPSPQDDAQSAAALGARLGELRLRHASLTILTEIVHLDERLVALRATVTVDGQIAAYGHAAKVADRTGNFVAEAELLAVQQALLLGGFTAEAEPVSAEPEPTRQSTAMSEARPLDQTIAEPSAPLVRRQRSGESRSRASAAAATPETGQVARPVSAPTTAAPVMIADAPIEADPTTAPSEASPTASAPAVTPAPEVLADTPAPAPRPRRDRAAQGNRAQTQAIAVAPPDSASEPVPSPPPSAEAGPSAAGDAAPPVPALPPAPAESPAAPPSEAEVEPPQSVRARLRQESLTTRPASASIVPDDEPPAPSRPSPPRRTRSAPVTAAAAPPPVPDGPPTQAQLRAAWRPGRPIPAWWPPERPPVERRVTRAQVERLRAIGLDEEITPAQLDTYSTMLFDQPVAGLDQTQYAILEERLNRAYPSPLEETGARRLIYPIAIGDTLTPPPDRPIFVRWRDVPPEETEEESPTPAPSTWRTRGPRVGRRRSSR